VSTIQSRISESNFFKRIDLNLVTVILVLNVIGLINLYSATHGITESINTRLFWQQLVWILVGWAVFFAVTLSNYQMLRRFAWPIYVVNLFALLLTDLMGRTYYGAQRWLDLGLFRYQPSETMKVALVLVFCRYLSSVQNSNGLTLRQLIVPGLATLFPVAITVDQPDLGTGLLLLGIAVSILFFVKVRTWIVIAGLASLLIAVPVMWSVGLKEYQKNRVLTFLSPGRDPRGTGYNSIQSKIAVGSGRFLGKGFRKGTQSQLEFIPERHSDFIFSVLSEEHGFVGSVASVGLFIVMFLTIIRIASQARDRFGTLIVVGVMSIMFLHVVINIGMVIGLLPIVGVPLPLLSYGGSSMLTTMAGLGLISSVAYRRYLF
jgi:rod shape determining protein RodA